MKFSTVIWIWVDTCCIFRFINVVFPQPLGPRITVIPLVSRSNEIPLRACTSLFLLWYVFRIFLSFIRYLTDCSYQYNTLLLPQGMLTVKDYLSTKKQSACQYTLPISDYYKIILHPLMHQSLLRLF